MNYQNNNPSPTQPNTVQGSNGQVTNPGSGPIPNPNKAPMLKDPKVKLALAAVLVLIVVIGLAMILSHKNKTPTTPTNPTTTQPSAVVPQAQVAITKNGFNPQTITVKAGTKVTWTSTDTTANHQIASDPYPKDDSLSALKSTQLGQNTTYSYTFTAKGTINYHDELQPTLVGTVVVE